LGKRRGAAMRVLDGFAELVCFGHWKRQMLTAIDAIFD
jgi:hypothetical protein